jgi:DNA-binding SARP family transcriptional activator
LWRLRRPGLALVDIDGRRIQLSADVTVDVREVSAFARRVINPSQDCDLTDCDAMALDGDVLPDWYEDWVMLERERFRQIRLHALEAVCDRYTGAGRYAQAVEAGLAAVRGEPLRESANRCLIKAFIAEGNRLDARRQYQRFSEILRQELGVEASPQMVTLGAGL